MLQIAYIYDPLSRLTNANYSTGQTFTYTYDAVGNRLSQSALGLTSVYTYDIANRLTQVSGVPYTWDNNGNLLDDGAGTTYQYDSANRLIYASVPEEQGDDPGDPTTIEYDYLYNGVGDRVWAKKTTCAGPCFEFETRYTLDLNAGLTQVLSDTTGTTTNSYVYGNGRIAQYAGATPSYFLGDALGSVRQLTNSSSAVTLAKSYQPYGTVLSSVGSGTSNYGYTGEWTDSTGLQYLRARYYAPAQGRFVQKDSWAGDMNRPMSYNAWLYGYANPINLTDPSGKDVYWPIKELETIKALKEDILASAKRHNTMKTNMDDASFAAFMTAILHWEGKLQGSGKPSFEKFKDFVGDLGANLVNYDASTGIANIRPSVALEILRGQIPGLEETFCYEINDSFTYEQALEMSILRSELYEQHYPPQRMLFFELQNEKKSIEYLAANTQRGADRITSLGFSASVFNLAAWANAGVQTPNEFAQPGVGPKGQSYGNVILATMPEAFEVLFGSGFVGRYLAYNAKEARFVDAWLREPDSCIVSKGSC